MASALDKFKQLEQQQTAANQTDAFAQVSKFFNLRVNMHADDIASENPYKGAAKTRNEKLEDEN